jgi:dihydrofolate reductase
MIKSIFAVDVWGGMGYRGSLPWPHNREDLQYFNQQTRNHIVVMGSKTWWDKKMPKPLPDRAVVVATTQNMLGQPCSVIKGDLTEGITKLANDNPEKTVWIIGGPEILMNTRHIVDEVHVSYIKGQYRSDVNIDLPKYLRMFRATSARPSIDRSCTWMTYKNIDIFRQVL